MRITFFLVLIVVIFSACKVEPQPINYSKDACHYCKMNIVETTHAAEIVTNKGKAYKYDAIECMLNDLKSRNMSDIGLFLVTDYHTPGKLMDATSATYLISPSIKSPMGANLTAFNKKDAAVKFLKSSEDSIYSWEEIQEQKLKDFKYPN